MLHLYPTLLLEKELVKNLLIYAQFYRSIVGIKGKNRKLVILNRFLFETTNTTINNRYR